MNLRFPTTSQAAAKANARVIETIAGRPACRKEECAAGGMSTQGLAQRIQSHMAKVRQHMTAKYEVAF